MTEAIDVAAARARLSAPGLILQQLKERGTVADELGALRARKAAAGGKAEAAA